MAGQQDHRQTHIPVAPRRQRERSDGMFNEICQQVGVIAVRTAELELALERPDVQRVVLALEALNMAGSALDERMDAQEALTDDAVSAELWELAAMRAVRKTWRKTLQQLDAYIREHASARVLRAELMLFASRLIVHEEFAAVLSDRPRN